jgi:hypothetical protein
VDDGAEKSDLVYAHRASGIAPGLETSGTGVFELGGDMGSGAGGENLGMNGLVGVWALNRDDVKLDETLFGAGGTPDEAGREAEAAICGATTAGRTGGSVGTGMIAGTDGALRLASSSSSHRRSSSKLVTFPCRTSRTYAKDSSAPCLRWRSLSIFSWFASPVSSL